jgi:hypothetical protein
MEIGRWFANNAVELLSAFGIVGSLFITTLSFRSEAKTRRIANLLSITANHRELWKAYLTDKELTRIRDVSAMTSKQPITEAERIFVTMVIQHLNTVFYAMNEQLVVKVEGMRRDVAQFLSLPIPREVWEKIKVLQNDDFVAFVESCRNWK